MNPIFDFLVEPYQNYNTLDIVLEAVAVLLGLLSVWFAKRDHIAVYPSGMLSTGIFVYILLQANLLGDMLINAYFFVMSIYGWYFWTRKKKESSCIKLDKINVQKKNGVFTFACVLTFCWRIVRIFWKVGRLDGTRRHLYHGLFFCRDVADGEKENRTLDLLDSGGCNFCSFVPLQRPRSN